MDAERFYDQLGQRLDMPRRENAVRAAEAVLMALHLRMREPASRELQQRLPPELQRLWQHGGEDLKEQRNAVSDMSRGQFVAYVGDRLGIRNATEAERVIREVFAVLRENVPETDALVRNEVPEDIRTLWSGVAVQR